MTKQDRNKNTHIHVRDLNENDLEAINFLKKTLNTKTSSKIVLKSIHIAKAFLEKESQINHVFSVLDTIQRETKEAYTELKSI